MHNFYGNQLTESLKSEAGKTFGQIVRFSYSYKLQNMTKKTVYLGENDRAQRAWYHRFY